MNNWLIIAEGAAFLYLFLHPQKVPRPTRLKQSLYLYIASMLIKSLIPVLSTIFPVIPASAALAIDVATLGWAGWVFFVVPVFQGLVIILGALSIFLLLTALQEATRQA